MGKFLCKSCGSEIKRALVAKSWPSNIRCKRCFTKHSVKHPWAFGIAYVIFLIALAVGAKLFADLLETKRGNVYSTLLQAVLELGGPLVALAFGVWLYTWALGRFAELRRHGP